jgi:predicted nucleic acid-binding protein
MRLPQCTIDSSCVIALDHLNLVPQLSLLFSRVLIPKAVREDLFKRRASKDRLKLLFEEFAFLERCDDYDKGTVDFLLAERARRGMKDRGEAEAVVQASQVGATVIVDDPWGRELAGRIALNHHGTLWALQRFYELGLVSASGLRNSFVVLLHHRTRLPWEIVNSFLERIGEEPLTIGPS